MTAPLRQLQSQKTKRGVGLSKNGALRQLGLGGGVRSRAGRKAGVRQKPRKSYFVRSPERHKKNKTQKEHDLGDISSATFFRIKKRRSKKSQLGKNGSLKQSHRLLKQYEQKKKKSRPFKPPERGESGITKISPASQRWTQTRAQFKSTEPRVSLLLFARKAISRGGVLP